jgi:hypothetical protein
VLSATYLHPGDLPLLDRVVTRLGALLGIRTTLTEGTSYDDVATADFFTQAVNRALGAAADGYKVHTRDAGGTHNQSASRG